jgi:uncharacterized protein YjbJ (UPF0337 family)
MNKDRVKGMIDQVAGSAKRKAGKLTDMVQQVKGKVENAWGKAKDAVHDAVENTEVHFVAHATLRSKNSTTGNDCNRTKQRMFQ